ncbi:MAG: chemotaxis protein CheW [Kofleriaceae bacterium]|nr:chemotaxis protein CheW [Kofleriaceae bacterium]
MGDALRVVCFELRGQELAIPIAEVRETVPMQPITRVFLTPGCLAGVFSLRGEIVPALDLAVLLGLPRTEVGDDSRIVVVAHPGGTAGIVVDRMRELRTLTGALEPPPANVTPSVAALMLGVAATETGTVRVLDTGAVLTVDALRALARPEAEEGRSS